ARLFEIEDDIASSKTKRAITALYDEILPEKRCYVISEALIELGATLCKPKNPNCLQCPLGSQCQSYQNGREHELPKKTKRVQYEELFREVAIIRSDDLVLLQKGEKGKIMADLYEFP